LRYPKRALNMLLAMRKVHKKPIGEKWRERERQEKIEGLIIEDIDRRISYTQSL
jgi:hypothetical protein